MMKTPLIKSLTAEASLASTALGRSLGEKIGRVTVRDSIPPRDFQEFGREDLVLTRHMGRFIKTCPGMKGYNCCNLQIIHLGLGCTIDCSYCILQDYLDSRALVVFGNFEEAIRELEACLDDPSGPVRFCTGEFTDSLLLEDLTGFGARLVELFANRKGRSLELKTKTTNIEGLLDLDHQGRTIISFSVNSPTVCRTQEPGGASLEERFRAAAQAVRAGYRVAFHFDPVIRHHSWEEDYLRTIDGIYASVPADRIAWISLGAFRYTPGLKNILRRRRPRSKIMDEEFVQAPDGKKRYLRPIRVEIYRRLLNAIRKNDPGACVYMCMESPRVWMEVFGYDPGTEGLVRMLDERIG